MYKELKRRRNITGVNSSTCTSGGLIAVVPAQRLRTACFFQPTRQHTTGYRTTSSRRLNHAASDTPLPCPYVTRTKAITTRNQTPGAINVLRDKIKASTRKAWFSHTSRSHLPLASTTRIYHSHLPLASTTYHDKVSLPLPRRSRRGRRHRAHVLAINTSVWRTSRLQHKSVVRRIPQCHCCHQRCYCRLKAGILGLVKSLFWA